MARLFFAIWPDEATAQRLHELGTRLAARAGGHAVPREKIHLTLAFLGEVAPARADDLVQAADAVKEAPFDLVLDRTGAFRRARVAWAGSTAPDPRLLAAESTLRRELRSRGFELEDRPFAPHVTLVRKVDRTLATEPIEPFAWHVGEIVLVRSELGSGAYKVMTNWPLKAKRGRAKG
ncbi:MAG TPA: RNA 2',3'-cyclic phosphodiesterase [Usitatibacter sp.]|nr:RNA 2',3'-cyclic phosphodiesterase [Usitatibacter sp.]